MENTEKVTLSEGSGGDVLREFQLAELSISEKSKPDFGIKLSRKIWGYINSGVGGYFYNRNARFQKNRNYANGRIDVAAMFSDRLEMNGKENYIRLVWQTLQIVNRIVSGLVGRWMARGEKIVVQAIDNLSQTHKQEEYEQIEFIIENREKLELLQQQSGVQMIPQGQELPADKEELNLWKMQFQRLPEEIENELGCNEVLASNSWFDVLKEKGLHDCAEVGFIGTYAWMDEQGVIHIDWVEPENSVYSSTKHNDFRDCTWMGDAPSMKISTLRRLYGKEFHPNDPLALTEEQLFAIAQTAKEYETVTNIVWDATWNTVFLRPYDEWNVRSLRFQIKTVDSEPYTVTTTKSNTTYTEKGLPKTSNGNKKQKPSENQKVIDDSNINIYEGVYLPDNDILLKWGLKTNMVRPQDPKEIGNAEFSYSFYMYQNYLMRNLAIPEKIEAAVDGMILALLKIQQIVARLVPSGWAIDETVLQNTDYGLGDEDNKAVDHAKHYFQTGLLYYHGIDAEGNRVELPIKELVNNGFVGQMDGLIKNYQFWYQTLRDELGEDPNLITAALQPRVTGSNVEASQQMSEFATDYIYRGYAECMKMTARKISCLLKDSITYGSKAYRDIVKDTNIAERQFSTDIRFLPTQIEVQRFDAILNQTIAANPELLQFLDPFRLMRIAREDVKLAELVFRNAQKKLIIYQKETAAANQKATFEAQIQSGKSAEEEKRKSLAIEVTEKGQIDLALSKEKQKEALINGFMGALQKGMAIPQEWKGVETELIHNIALPLFAQNMKDMQQVANMAGQEQMAQQQAQPQQQIQQSQQPELAA